ncbi:MAG: isoleucine--tRNA ligase [Trueperaceae bacterium]|nr:isoleucine--tRNA ligase [Trueperaceae bacterium]
MFDEVPNDPDFPALEREVIERWRERDVFGASLRKPAPKGPWVFYEGPPTANGKPGVHHVISRAFKDLFPRFRTMQGYHVERKGGWDTHGLPVEIAIEQRLGFTSKQQIEEYGIEAFNRLCREYVFENIQDWTAMTERIAFWLDLENAYVTYDNDYIESCWWIFENLYQRGLLQEDYKTTWHSPSSNTTLASHEVSLGYEEDVEDPSVYPAFPADEEELRARDLLPSGLTTPVRLLAWTTTPWTLPANTGLAVAADATYALVHAPARRGGSEMDTAFILAQDRVADVFGDDPHDTLTTFAGRALEGLPYRPILRGRAEATDDAARGHRVVLDPSVSLEDGTGVLHLAPAYGDLEQGRTHGLPTLFSVSLTGEVLPEVAPLDHSDGTPGPYAGRWFKEADGAIADDLIARGLMYRRDVIRHAYPFNWRDGKPLMNVAKKSWYIRTTALKDRLLANNDRVDWVPDHIRTGRFGNWLEGNVDWAISRERYWGCPLPIWEAEDGSERICVGSVAQLESLTGRDLSGLDLHRPYVDEVTFDKNGKRFTRVPYTVDVWFESGAMPYAQHHYLGNATEPDDRRAFERAFPADYICEAIDQTRGWFYSLHALGTLLTDDGAGERPAGPLAHLAPNTSAFRNVIVLGHIVDENGEKMSKSKGNVVDPWTVLNAQGSDALRWYMYSASPPEATKRFSPGLVEASQRDFMMTLWNVYGFFVMYANLDRPDLSARPRAAERPEMDRWLVSRAHALVRDVTERLEAFDATGASRQVRDFVVDDLSNWYVRRNRKRFWKSRDAADQVSAYQALHEALVTVAKLIAPMAPFLAELLYRNLVVNLDLEAPASVHLADWPLADEAVIDDALMRDMRALIRVVELGRAARAQSGVKIRQPLPAVLVRVRSEAEAEGVRRLEGQLLEELNVKEARYLSVNDAFVDYDVKPNLPRLGRRLGPKIPALREALAQRDPRQLAKEVSEGRSVRFELDGDTVELEAEAFLLDARSPEGFAAVEDRGYLAALDTTLTDALRREGMARDAVRLVQNARKKAGFAVSDRIRLSWASDAPEVVAALQEHQATVQEETLARVMTRHDTGARPEGEHRETGTLDGANGTTLEVVLSREAE